MLGRPITYITVVLHLQLALVLTEDALVCLGLVETTPDLAISSIAAVRFIFCFLTILHKALQHTIGFLLCTQDKVRCTFS